MEQSWFCSEDYTSPKEQRNTSNLSEEDWTKIEEWLRGEEGNCPGISCSRCKDLFPSLPTYKVFHEINYSCPCNHHNLEYVTFVVKKLLEERREKLKGLKTKQRRLERRKH